VDLAQHTVKRDERGAAGDKDERAQAEGGPIDFQATTDGETFLAQFKISPDKARGAEARARVEDEPGREKKAGEDAALKNQGGTILRWSTGRRRRGTDGRPRGRKAGSNGGREGRKAG
jgi:hypothetical protein